MGWPSVVGEALLPCLPFLPVTCAALSPDGAIDLSPPLLLLGDAVSDAVSLSTPTETADLKSHPTTQAWGTVFRD